MITILNNAYLERFLRVNWFLFVDLPKQFNKFGKDKNCIEVTIT